MPNPNQQPNAWPYFERRIGKPIPRQSKTPNDDGKPEQRSIPEWFETYSENWANRDLQPIPEKNFLDTLPSNACAIVLADPGGGKTWLANNMARTLANKHLDTTLWPNQSPAPIFARCRNAPENTAHVWDVIEAHSQRINQPIGRDKLPEHITPTFILDGLDELPRETREAFARTLQTLTGIKILTCRTAIWETELRQIFNTTNPLEYRLMGLNDQEKLAFLTQQNHQTTNPQTLLQAIKSNPSLHALASNPLMLGLIAENGATLPANRAELYETTIEKRWQELEQKPLRDTRKTPSRNERIDLKPKGDALMMRLAETLVTENTSPEKNQTKIRTVFFQADLEQTANAASLNDATKDQVLDALQTNGLLTAEGNNGYAFVHPTFQEHALAQAWLFGNDNPKTIATPSLEERLHTLIQQHWLHVEFEETLALAMSVVAAKGGNVAGAVRGLMEQTTVSVEDMRQHKRSALRTALHFLTRAGAKETPELLACFNTNFNTEGRKIAAASDIQTPGFLLTELSSDENEMFHQGVAANPNTPPRILEKLGENPNGTALQQVARNPNTPSHILETLSINEHTKWIIPSNPSTPLHIIETLSKSESGFMRELVAQSLSTPLHILEALSTDENENVRKAVTENPNTPLHILEALNGEETIGLIPNVELDLNRPDILHELIAQLQGKSDVVRQSIALNSKTPLQLLKVLSSDENSFVRQCVAVNPNTPLDILETLSKDESYGVRWGVAENPNASPQILKALSKDASRLVSWAVAKNPSTIIEDL